MHTLWKRPKELVRVWVLSTTEFEIRRPSVSWTMCARRQLGRRGTHKSAALRTGRSELLNSGSVRGHSEHVNAEPRAPGALPAQAAANLCCDGRHQSSRHPCVCVQSNRVESNTKMMCVTVWAVVVCDEVCIDKLQGHTHWKCVAIQADCDRYQPGHTHCAVEGVKPTAAHSPNRPHIAHPIFKYVVEKRGIRMKLSTSSLQAGIDSSRGWCQRGAPVDR
jgi:hypothetical protein